MKKLIKNIFVCITILFLNTGCYTYIQMPKIVPPEIMLEENEKTVQLVDFFDVSKLGDLYNEKHFSVYETGIENLKNGFEESFEKNEDYNLFVYDSVQKGHAHNRLPKTLSEDSIKLFCVINNTAILLALESFNIFFDKEIEESDDGKVANYSLVVEAGLSLYDSSGHVINRSEIYLDKFIDSRNVIVLNMAFRPSYKKNQETIDKLSFKIGNNYINKFYPSEVIELKLIYLNKEFDEVIPYIKQYNWEKTIELLKPITESDNKKIAGKAAHNLSVAYEGAGDIENSTYWDEISRKLLNK